MMSIPNKPPHSRAPTVHVPVQRIEVHRAVAVVVGLDEGVKRQCRHFVKNGALERKHVASLHRQHSWQIHKTVAQCGIAFFGSDVRLCGFKLSVYERHKYVCG